jgi:glucose dehydrogenase
LLCCAFSIEPLFAQQLDWLSNGNDVSNSRFQSIDQITLSSVSQLKQAWVFHAGTGGPTIGMEMTPLVVNGVMYVTDGVDDVFALMLFIGRVDATLDGRGAYRIGRSAPSLHSDVVSTNP